MVASFNRLYGATRWLNLKGYSEPPNLFWGVAPFKRLYGASRWLHLNNYLDALVAPNSQLNGATLSPGWLKIVYPHKILHEILKESTVS